MKKPDQKELRLFYRKALFLLIPALFFLTAGRAQRVVYVPVGFPKDVLSDVSMLLSRATGESWKTINGVRDVSSGIILQLGDLPEFKTKETFRLQSNGSSLLT